MPILFFYKFRILSLEHFPTGFSPIATESNSQVLASIKEFDKFNSVSSEFAKSLIKNGHYGSFNI